MGPTEIRNSSLSTSASGFLLVAFGAALWGTDALFRQDLALELPAAVVVTAEHLVLAVILAPVAWMARGVLAELRWRDWVSLLVIGAGSSALATVLFTASFRYGHPNTPLLLQKLQPILAVLAARFILGERIHRRFVLFLIVAMTGAFLIAFPDPARITLSSAAPALLAIGAAVLWALGTVLGRRLTGSLAPSRLTSMRVIIGLLFLTPIVSIQVGPGQAARLAIDSAGSILPLALIPGLLALLIYYRGLRSTPASAATLAELAFPLTAVSINYLAFGAVLTGSQWVGLVILSSTLVVMGWPGRQEDGARKLGVTAPTPTPAQAIGV